MVFNIQHYAIQDGPGVRTTVFLKGCPLRCWWCSNPESQNSFPEVAHSDSLCNKCGKCLDVCDVRAIRLDDSHIEINRDTCNTCGKCVEVCSMGALKIYGRQMTLEEVLDEVRKETLFYWNSGGGVTASGGEPLSQSEFVSELFRYCQRSGIHTVLDTCGFAKNYELKRVLSYTDLVLYDLKFIDSAAHKEFTGHSNEPVLDNAKIIAKSGVPIIIRIPLIPDINDSEDNMSNLSVDEEEEKPN